MRIAIVTLSILLCSAACIAQGADANLQRDLEALHAKWFTAFDGGDGATMDQVEMDTLKLVMPTGAIWAKTEPRSGKQPKHDPRPERTLSDVSVRRLVRLRSLRAFSIPKQLRRTQKRRRA
jgi:hypothetical protein